MNFATATWILRSLLFGAGIGLVSGKVLNSFGSGLAIGLATAVLMAVVWKNKRKVPVQREEKQLFLLLLILGLILGMAGLITFLLIG